MQAVVQQNYGPPEALTVAEVDTPTPGDGEVLVRVRAASVHPDVWHVVTGRPYLVRLLGGGLRAPRHAVPGTDMAGVVESRGSRFSPGDRVFGETVRGHQWHNGGAFAEYVAVREDALAPLPADVPFEAAATVPTAGIITLQNLPALAPGAEVLVNGAAGGVGALATQLARAAGAHVTGVEHPSKLDLVTADETLDHTTTDFTTGDTRYDLIFDIPGNHPLPAIRRALKPTGKYVLIGHDGYGSRGRWLGSTGRVFKLVALSPFLSQLPSLSLSTPSKQDLMATLAKHLAAGELTPTIDRTFPLSEAAAALRHLTTGTARGRIVLTM